MTKIPGAGRFAGWLVGLRDAATPMRVGTLVALMGIAGWLVQPVAEANEIGRQQVAAREFAQRQAAQAPPVVQADRAFPPHQPEFDLSQALGAALEQASAWQERASSGGPLVSEAEVLALRDELLRLDAAARHGFAEVQAFLAQTAAPAEVVARHAEEVARYEVRIGELMSALDEAAAAPDLATRRTSPERLTRALAAQLEAQPRPALDPNRLPMRPVEEQKRAPALSAGELRRALAGGGSGLRARALSEPPTAWVRAGSPPTPADLAANQDAQITPEVQALATSLGGSPLAIYNWVHDNIELVPTYGSIQGSRMTLEGKRGNAFDAASLLVALLRAANVPARYVLGTIEVPVPTLLNWLGGVASAREAQQLLGVGGIPNVGLLQGGQITHVRLEHVWVEAWVDFVPGRGAQPGSGDSWVPLDPSFKQIELTPDRGIVAAVPFDVEAVWAQMTSGGQYDPTLERTVGIDPNLMQDALFSFQQSAQEYALANGIPSTQESLLGKAAIRPAGLTALAASLPYQVLSRNGTSATLPDGLRPRVSLTGYASAFDRALGNDSFTYSLSLPELNTRRLAITFPPATAADAAVLANARLNHLASLPVYLVNVTPTVTLDGAVVASGPPVRMGSVQYVDVGLRDTDGNETIAYQVTAGDESVVGINGNGIVEGEVAARLARMPSDTTVENLQQVGLHYWMESDYFDSLAARNLGVHNVRRLSVGLFFAPLTVSYFFGSPRSGVYQSRVMDVKRSLVGVAAVDEGRRRTFVRTSGLQGSYLEGSVLDQLYQRRLGAGVSAVQLMQDAILGNIPIYHVTPANASQVLPLLHVPGAVRTDIVNAIAAGKTVLVPENDFLKDNYRGLGYIVEDPETGAAAYLIAGGQAGGGLFDCLPDLVPVLIVILVIILIIALIWWLWPVIAGALAGAGAAIPALARAIAALIAMALSTAPAYAAGGLVSGNQADPCNCPPLPPPPPCRVDLVPPSVPHWPCPGSHWHYQVWNQGPAPACRNFLSSWYLGDCIPPPVPVPCPPI